MAAGRIKGITIEIGADTTKLTSALSQVDRALKTTQTNLRDIDKALKFDPGNTQLLKDKQNELSHAITETKEKIDTEKTAYEQLASADRTPENVERMRQLKTQIDLDTASLKELEKQSSESASVLGTQMQLAGDKITAVGDKIKGVGDKITGLGTTMTTRVTAPIMAAFGASIKSAVDWESAFTGVMKTVDETATTTYDDLKDRINEIAQTTASSQNEIAATMEISGQLGVIADDVGDFTETMIKLGDTTNLSSEEAASSIARFANITQMSMDDVDKLGAAIVYLGNNYATTEQDIMEMALRLAGAGHQINLTDGQILGLSAALSSVGIRAEMGGSAMSKAMIKMQVAVETGFEQVNDVTKRAGMSLRDLELMSTNDTKGFKEMAQSLKMTTTELKEVITNGNNLANFAEVAGYTTEEFVDLYRNDAPAALQAFVAGLGDTDGKGESTIAMLQDMGFTEVRLRDTLTRLASAQGLVTDAMEQGDTAFEENTALNAEAEKRYATMESQMSQLKARFTEVAVSIGEMLIPHLQKMMDYVDQVIAKWKELTPEQQEFILKIAAIVAAVGPVLVIVGSVISAIGTIISVIGTLVSWIGSAMTAVQALIPIIAAIGAPVVAVVAAIGALIAAFIYFYNTNETFRNGVLGVWESIKQGIVAAFQQVQTWLAMLGEWLAPVLEAFAAFGEALIGQVTAIIDRIMEFINAHKMEINMVLATWKLMFINTFEVIKAQVVIIFNVIKEVIIGALNILSNIFKAFSAVLKGDWKGALNYLVQAASSFGTMIKNIFQRIIDGIKTLFNTLVQNFKNWGREMIDSLVSGIKEKIGQVPEAIASGLGKFASFFTGDSSSAASEIVGNMEQTAYNAANGIVSAQSSMSRASSTMTANRATATQAATLQASPVVVNVALEGDANRLFRVVKAEALRTQQITGIAFA